MSRPCVQVAPFFDDGGEAVCISSWRVLWVHNQETPSSLRIKRSDDWTVTDDKDISYNEVNDNVSDFDAFKEEEDDI